MILDRPNCLALIATVLAGCAPDLRVDHPFDGEVSDGPLFAVRVEDSAGAVRHATVDATSKGSQVYVDLDSDRELKVAEAFRSNAWDLAFRRFEISMNGGAGNPAGRVRVLVLRGIPFEEVRTAPPGEFQQDGTDRVFSAAQGGWYVYDLSVHRVVARSDLVYVVETSEGVYFKVRLLDYYSPQGTPAFITMDYASLPRP
jgi:hypothetical protein